MKKSEKNKNRKPNPNPLDRSNFFSLFTFLCLSETVNKANKKVWTAEMNYDLHEYDKCTTHKARVAQIFKEKKSLLTVLFEMFKTFFVFLLIGIIISNVLSSGGSICKSKAVGMINDGLIYQDRGNFYIFTLYLFGISFLASFSKIIDNFLSFSFSRPGFRMKSKKEIPGYEYLARWEWTDKIKP